MADNCQNICCKVKLNSINNEIYFSNIFHSNNFELNHASVKFLTIIKLAVDMFGCRQVCNEELAQHVIDAPHTLYMILYKRLDRQMCTRTHDATCRRFLLKLQSANNLASSRDWLSVFFLYCLMHSRIQAFFVTLPVTVDYSLFFYCEN